MYIFGDFAGEFLVIPFLSEFSIGILPFAFIFSMPPRKKVTGILTSLGEN